MHTTNSSYFFNMLYSFVHLNEILTFKWLKFELNLISSLTLCINVTSKASRLADSCITFVYGLGFVFLCFFFWSTAHSLWDFSSPGRSSEACGALAAGLLGIP